MMRGSHVLAVACALVAVAIPADASARVVTGTFGADVLRGGSGADLLNGRGGNDRIYGAGGNDRLKGGAGKDRLDGGRGDDKLDGGPGTDTLVGGGGDDTLRCGAGRDLVLVDTGDTIARDCENARDSATGQPVEVAPTGSVEPGSTPPPTPAGQTCKYVTKTVLVLEGFGSAARYVYKVQVVLECTTGTPGGGTPAPQCSDGRDNDSDGAVDFPKDKGCTAASDTSEFPDPVSGLEELLKSRNGFWWELPRIGGEVCNLYVFQITSTLERIGSRQAFFESPFTGECTISGTKSAFAWSVTDAPGKVGLIKIQFVSGFKLDVDVGSRSDALDTLAVGHEGYSWTWAGCSSSRFPSTYRPPGCF